MILPSVDSQNKPTGENIYFTRVGLRLRSASGGRESPDFCSVHAVNQGIDIPRSPKKYINSDRAKYSIAQVRAECEQVC